MACYWNQNKLMKVLDWAQPCPSNLERGDFEMLNFQFSIFGLNPLLLEVPSQAVKL